MLSPFWVQANDCIVTLLGIFFVSFAQILATHLSKVKSMIIMDLSGVSLFFAVVYVYDN